MVNSSMSQASSFRSQSPHRPGVTSPNSSSSQSHTGSLFSTLHDISPVLEFLTDDERPTLILEVLSSNVAVPHIPRVVYQNVAFTSFLNRTTTRDSFDDWLRSLSTNVAVPSNRPVRPFGGRAWSSKRFRNAWRVVYCSQLDDDRRLDSVAEALTETPSDNGDLFMLGSSPGHEQSMDASSFRDVDENGERKIIDWTRFPQKVRQSPWIDFIKTYPFENTPLGPMSAWPDDLRRLAVLIMSSPDPRMVYWGNDHAIIYNEAAATLLGSKHPNFSLGNKFVDVWGPEILERHRKMIRVAVHRGKVADVKDFEAILERNGFIEETFWSVQLQPCTGPDGRTVAVLNEYRECTSAVFQDQRRKLIDKIQQLITSVDNLPDLWDAVATQLQNHLHDASYALIYTAAHQPEVGFAINRVATFQLAKPVGVAPHSFEAVVNAGERFQRPSLGPAFAEARRTQQIVALQDKDGNLPPELALLIPDRGFVNTACVLPITSVSGQQLAFIVLGMNPRRYFDDELRVFVSHVGDLISKAAALISLPEEQRRDQEKFEQINFALSQQLRITALKAEKNEQTFTRMARNAPFGMYMFDADGNPKYVNDAYLKLMGLTREDFEDAASSGRAWRDSIYEEDIDLVENLWNTLRVSKVPTTAEYRVKVKSTIPGRPTDVRTLESISFSELDETGRVVTVQGWLLDISHRKAMESLMSQRLEDALENKRASENFIDLVSHEMRNPLSAILQLADGILSSLEMPSRDLISLPAETISMMIDSAQTITLCAQHQKCIVDDILTLSKLDSSLLTITPDRIQPPDLIRKALKMYDAELERANIEATLEVQESYINAQLDYVMLDPSRVLQVIINLLTNSIKFTQYQPIRRITVFLSAFEAPPSGDEHRVTFIEPRQRQSTAPLSTSPEWGAGEEIYIRFAVEDTGKGLTQDEMKLLWQRFSQANPKTYKQYGGSGLGLFISRELTELQGGKIGVASEAGVGSVFMFYIKARRCVLESKSRQSSLSAPTVTNPVILPETAAEKRRAAVAEGTLQNLPPPAPTPPQDIHILVVEDNAINQRVMSQQLRKLGCIVNTADHGLDCLNFLSRTTFAPSSGKIPLSIILMDLEMPIMDGLTCVSKIREQERTGQIVGHVPVIAITANARSEQIHTALDAGMDEVVTKPFRIPDLLPRMQALLSGHHGG